MVYFLLNMPRQQQQDSIKEEVASNALCFLIFFIMLSIGCLVFGLILIKENSAVEITVGKYVFC